MFVRKWMSTNVVTIDENATLSEAIHTLKRNNIRRLPVMSGEELVGIVSDRDLKEASPSKVTSLDIWEVHYLMSKIKIKDIMKKNPVTISPDDTIEKAAILMFDNKIGGLPVLDNGKLVGILTEQDVFNALINITGARIPSFRVSLTIPDKPGSIKDVCDKMREYEFKCISILTTKQGVEEGKREVIIRFHAEGDELDKIKEMLAGDYPDIIITKDL